MAKYLYGANIKGIHEFISSTNKLKEIVGASLLLQDMRNILKDEPDSDKYKPSKVYVNAASKIEALFDEEEVKKIYRELPKEIFEKAYGVTLAQAAVKIKGDEPSKEDFKLLDERLKAARNIQSVPLDLAHAVIKLAPRTGKPAIGRDENELIDTASKQKRERAKKFYEEKKWKKERNISYYANKKNKIAVIHADGNGLGEVVMEILEQEKGAEKIKEFSQKLDEVVKKSFEEAQGETGKERIKDLIMEGDDLVVLMNPDYVLPFLERLFAKFEEYAQEMITNNKELNLTKKLSICAGVAIVHDKYPFAYALNLAEILNSEAKKASKMKKQENYIPSSVKFYHLQSGNIVNETNWQHIKEQTLRIKSDEGVIDLDYGPYYLKDGFGPTIAQLRSLLELYRKKEAPLSKLRSWLPMLHQDSKYASFVLNRINKIAQSKWKEKSEADKLLLEIGIDPKTLLSKDRKTIIYDILQLHSAQGEKA